MKGGGDLAVFLQWHEAGFMGDHTLDVQRFLYRGYQWDDTLKMYHVRHRVYDPARMLWIQRDPLGRIPGVNEYAYCLGEPVDFYDPTGLDKWWISEPFYYIGGDVADAVGEYLNDAADGAASLFDKNDAAHEGVKDGLILIADATAQILTVGGEVPWLPGAEELHDERNRILEQNPGWEYEMGNGAAYVGNAAAILAAGVVVVQAVLPEASCAGSGSPKPPGWNDSWTWEPPTGRTRPPSRLHPTVFSQERQEFRSDVGGKQIQGG